MSIGFNSSVASVMMTFIGTYVKAWSLYNLYTVAQQVVLCLSSISLTLLSHLHKLNGVIVLGR